ncbi:hypothetical protein DCS_07214 [Drechmeria coniospora]|uniref:Cytochrome b561 domain-containing protein n=1 Tax=Drechmeria coniospora TaxID=98403 RepID=A0A151GDV5_DRECN|nr:hypothetical protein DCS_07214 [Drechmeria coniospora]KYK55251.1 hypothetical protein DCS_07214 [Drechmeria coniospora]
MTGTGVLAQFGVLLLVAVVWAAVFMNPIILFSGHPIGQSLAVFLLFQSVLFLQPTHTADQKRVGQRVHASLNLAAFLSLVAGVAIVEYNKGLSRKAHFHSVHAYLGTVAVALLVVQYLVGFTMWATPGLWGGEDKAKKLWRLHRIFAYAIVLPLLLLTVLFSTRTDYVAHVLNIPWWSLLVASVLIVAGVYPRLQLYKILAGPRHVVSPAA